MKGRPKNEAHHQKKIRPSVDGRNVGSVMLHDAFESSPKHDHYLYEFDTC
jgi:hypothetical protein